MLRNKLKNSLCIDLLGYGLYRALIVSHFSLSKKTSSGDIFCDYILYASIALSALLFIVFRRWVSYSKSESAISIVVFILGPIGSLLAFFGQMLAQPAYLVTGFFLVGICGGYFEVKWAYKFLALSDERVYFNVILAFLLAAVLNVLSTSLLPDSLFFVESIVLFFGMGACFFFGKTKVPEQIVNGERTIDFRKEKTPLRSKTFLRVILTCFLFSTILLSATSICYNSLPVSDVFMARSIANFITAALLLIIFLLRGVVSPLGLIKAILPITAAGLFLQLLDTAFLGLTPVIILLIGNKLFDMLIIVLLIKLVQCAEIGPAFGFGFFVATKNLGVAVGTTVGTFAVMQMGQGAWNLSSFVAILVMLLLTTLLWVFSGKMLNMPEGGSTNKNGRPVVSIDIVDKASRMAQVTGLTQRETEVFLLLARGKNKAAIAEEQGVSKSTIHAHMMHIYQKLGVHSQQELIVLVEQSHS